MSRVYAVAWRAGLLLMLAVAWPAVAERAPDRVLEGSIDGRDHQSYRLLPFDVPAGTSRITVAFDYEGRERKTAIDLGLLGPDGFDGPDGFRGWSGGNKPRFTVSAHDATPSYFPGALHPGTWSLLLGIPNIRQDERADYRASIWLDAVAAEPVEAPLVLDGTARWYRGDLHLHSGHSDASCDSQSGARVPCPLFLSAQAAAAAGLDFVAVTEHNTASHLHELLGLQPYFDRLLLMPGMEVTTFQGHVNVFGLAQPLDFRLGSEAVPDWNALLDAIDEAGMPASINHPALPSDERCMGCGWTPRQPVSMGRFAAIEVVNGGDADTPVSGIGFWQRQLDAGHRLTGIGGSDNHDATRRGAALGAARIGAPTTVIHATALSQAALLDGLRRGRVFIDVEGSRDRHLILTARHEDRALAMGDVVRLATGDSLDIGLDVRAPAGSRIELLLDGRPLALPQDGVLHADSRTDALTWRSDGARHWLRADVRSADGRLLLVGNPIYIDVDAPAHAGH
ncbi:MULTISPECIES: CehA/McbA family metallohydrolase [Luteimonas]|uniref:CehA/McbA family metallohydrolase n=1 Tax=Luteimonas TaxID=83614 RepID=UPI001E601D48|nr:MULTISPECIES: CehA/McbA family metallohydrolase [Luteimonas]